MMRGHAAEIIQTQFILGGDELCALSASQDQIDSNCMQAAHILTSMQNLQAQQQP